MIGMNGMKFCRSTMALTITVFGFFEKIWYSPSPIWFINLATNLYNPHVSKHPFPEFPTATPKIRFPDPYPPR